jgi:uncharacterized damage-inducible protein DinB
MIQSIESFCKYFESIRRRTLNYVRTIPPEKINWSPAKGRFSCGDLLRHLAATEETYVAVVIDSKWHYHGHAKGKYNTLDEIIVYMYQTHDAAMIRLKTVSDSELNELRPSPVSDARSVKMWRWLMVMVEHEVHHRSELASYLTMMGVEPPQIFGLSVEELSELAQDD